MVAGSTADSACAPGNSASYLRRALGASNEGSCARTVAPSAKATLVVPWPANFSTLVISSTRSFSIMAQGRWRFRPGQPCPAVACEFFDVREQPPPVFQHHGGSSSLPTMVDPTDPRVPAGPEQASFGYRDVPAAEKAGMVRRVFESV